MKAKKSSTRKSPRLKIRRDEAERFIELLRGNAGGVSECYHGLRPGGMHVHGDIRGGRGVRDKVKVQDVGLEIENWNLQGREVYVTAHAVKRGVKHNPLNDDIEAGRALFIDSDGEPLPGEWHLEPTFLIEREDTPDTSWWAFWVIDGEFPPEEIEPYQRRLAAEYGTDPSVSDARRIVRLPGYVRHQHNEGPGKSNPAEGDTMYRLVGMPGAPHSTLADHDAKLPEVPDQQKRETGAPRAGRERCSERYMGDALAHISPDRKRKDGWLQVLAAFVDADVICEDGQPLPDDEKIEKLRAWSAKGATYDEEKFEEDWEWYEARTDDEDRTRVGLGTIDMLAREHGYTGPAPMRSTTLAVWPSLFAPIVNQEVIPPPNFDLTEKKGVRQTLSNAFEAVHHMAACGIKPQLDELDGNIYFRDGGVPWSSGDQGCKLDDTTLTEIRLYVAREYGLNMAQADAEKVISVVARHNSFHPIREYLRELAWDAIPRLDTWITDYFGAEDTAFIRAAGRKWMLAAIWRVMKPGYKFDHMLILEGVQGIGKSTAFRTLAVKDEWFADHLPLNLADKDAALGIEGKWIIEMSELDSLQATGISSLKTFLSREADRIRRPYGTLMEDLPRQCVIAGTTNDNSYLLDQTGARRFWPVRCNGAIDIAGLESRARPALGGGILRGCHDGRARWLAAGAVARGRSRASQPASRSSVVRRAESPPRPIGVHPRPFQRPT